ncbi:MAG TPA: ROK family protein [Pseudorhizobium sp.]|nr:ROK family protein [Pseudorhizobium sp.]
MTDQRQWASQRHGATRIGDVLITSYNVELRDRDGFLGDKASVGAFLNMVDERRDELLAAGPCEFDHEDDLTPEHLDAILVTGTERQKHIAQEVIAAYAQRLTAVLKAHLELDAWQDIGAIIVGGGFEHTRAGKAAVVLAQELLSQSRNAPPLQLLRHHPDEAGLIGCIHLVPEATENEAGAILACDIGGTNFRCGIVQLPSGEDRSVAKVRASDKWRHGGRDQRREEALDHLVAMLCNLAGHARQRAIRLMPFVGVACPGIIQSDGRIERGAQNLPGNWEDARFNLPKMLEERLSGMADLCSTEVRMHNDAVVQGLSEELNVRDKDEWAIVTIGTGFGNATFRREPIS